MKIFLLVALLMATFPSYAVAQTTIIAYVDVSSQSSCVEFSKNMRYRMRDSNTNNEVSALQDFLNKEGYLSYQPTGFFGAATLKAVKSFQSASGFYPTGYVGPLTRGKIKAMTCKGITTKPAVETSASAQKDATSITGATRPSVVSPLPAPSLTVLSPNGGETFTKGTTQTIKWQDNTPVQGCGGNTVGGPTIYCSSAAPESYEIRLFAYSPPCTGLCTLSMIAPFTIASGVIGTSYDWTVGNVLDIYNNGITTAPEGAYTIKICSTLSAVCDSSDNYFKVKI